LAHGFAEISGEDSLKICYDRKLQLREKSLPLEGCGIVAGHTYKGVTILQQVYSFCECKQPTKASFFFFKFSCNLFSCLS